MYGESISVDELIMNSKRKGRKRREERNKSLMVIIMMMMMFLLVNISSIKENVVQKKYMWKCKEVSGR